MQITAHRQSPALAWLGQQLEALGRSVAGTPPPAPPTPAQAAAAALQQARVDLLAAQAEVERYSFTVLMLEARVERLSRVG